MWLKTQQLGFQRVKIIFYLYGSFWTESKPNKLSVNKYNTCQPIGDCQNFAKEDSSAVTLTGVTILSTLDRHVASLLRSPYLCKYIHLKSSSCWPLLFREGCLHGLVRIIDEDKVDIFRKAGPLSIRFRTDSTVQIWELEQSSCFSERELGGALWGREAHRHMLGPKVRGWSSKKIRKAKKHQLTFSWIEKTGIWQVSKE